ncbi:MAG TPA: helix-turn-helix domain-containing protein, partial [Solirubrobacteraceae bacterium]|nr:helix-turn-helix domain-containing protein [Solirubrobacteraceae bacterium]
MKRTSLNDHPCSIARSLEVVGEWWTPLILRDVFYGLRRFGDLQEDLGISANVLADRLATLVREGVLETRVYRERPERREYVLSEKGRELLPALLALMRWGDRWGWQDEAGAPV